MKKIFCLVLVGIMIFSLFATPVFAGNTNEAKATSSIVLRAGGGGGGSGGGGGGGGGSGCPHHSGNGRPMTLLGSILQYCLIAFMFFFSSIIFYIQLTKRSRKAKKMMKQLTQSDNAWKFKDISDTVSNSFYAIQNAWADLDMTPASQYMSDDLFERFQTKLNWMKYRKEKNILEKVQLLHALPVSVYDDNDNSRDYIWFYIKGKMVDYTINTETQLKISGSTSSSSFVEYWQFVREEDTWVLNEILQKNEADKIPFVE